VSDIVEVAAAVMLRAGGSEFLLAQRPVGKVYAGYWEFPGGKVEPGESVRDALVRELQEELGITVTACHPWLTRRQSLPGRAKSASPRRSNTARWTGNGAARRPASPPSCRPTGRS